MKTIDKSNLDKIIDTLIKDGYTIIAPVVKDGAIIYDEIEGIKDLPAGWGDEQEAGHYRIKKRNNNDLFVN